MSTLNTIDVDHLLTSALTMQPVDHDWSPDPEDGAPEPFRVVEAFDYEDDEATYTLVADDGVAAAIVVNGTCIDLWAYDEYLEAIDVEDEDDARDTFASLTEVEPVMHGAEGPMVNYFYPLMGIENEPVEAAAKLGHLPLCVVQLADGRTGLALTGGGMDLSWEICEAFIRLGYLPPTHFAMLPGMADRGTSDRDRVIVAACRRSFAVAAERAQRDLDYFNDRYPA